MSSKAKKWRAVVNFGTTGSWQQNGFATKEAAEKAAAVKAAVIRRKRGRWNGDVGYRAEPEE